MFNWLARMVNLVARPVPGDAGVFYGRGAGMTVTPASALALSTVWSCVRIISETIASLGWHIVENDRDGSRNRQLGTSLDWLLNSQANPEMTAFSWRETALMHVLLHGNHFSEIERDTAGRVVALWPIDPLTQDVRVYREEDGRIVYIVHGADRRESRLDPRNVLHIHGLASDGLLGLSVLSVARRGIGLGLAMEELGANFYANGAHVGVALKHPGKLSITAKEVLTASIREAYAGSGNAFKTMVLEEGMDVAKLSMSMIDAQFLESRKFGVLEICRWFRVPPHKVAELERATFSNIEHQAIEFVQDTILPWCRRLEQEVDIKLFGSARQGRVTTRLNIDTLLRGDIVSRYQAFEKGRLGGWLSANDIRRLENLNPIENGDIYLQPMNYVEAGAVPEPVTPVAPPIPDANPDAPSEPVDNVIRREAMEWRRSNG